MSKIAAITGGCKGLGAALAQALAKRHHKLVLGSRNKEELEAFVEKIKPITEVIPVIMDVRNKKDCEKFVNAAVKAFGRLDLLINNAGVMLKRTDIGDVTEEELRDTFETNVFGPVYCAKAAIKIMKKQNRGHILNIGSTSAVNYKSRHLVYSASKSAIVSITGSMREDLKNTNIRVSCFSPGGMKTSLFRKQVDSNTESYMDPHFVAEKIMKHVENPSDDWHVILRRT